MKKRSNHTCFFFSSRRRHTRCYRDWSSDVCSSDLPVGIDGGAGPVYTVGGHRDGAPATLAAWLHEVELELVGDLRNEAALNPWFDRLAEREPRVHRARLSPRLGVPNAHYRVRLPPGPHRIEIG